MFTLKDIRDFGGSPLILKYHSLAKLLNTVFPEYDLSFNKFTQSSFWGDEENHLLIETIAKKLNIKEMSDWYKVSNKVFQRGFKGVTNKGFYQVWWKLFVV